MQDEEIALCKCRGLSVQELLKLLDAPLAERFKRFNDAGCQFPALLAKYEALTKERDDNIRKQNATLERTERSLYLQLDAVERERDALKARVAELEASYYPRRAFMSPDVPPEEPML